MESILNFLIPPALASGRCSWRAEMGLMNLLFPSS